MIKIENIIGKYIYFIDKNQAFRISKVIAVHGNTITTQQSNGEKERIHPQQNKIMGIVIHKGKSNDVVEEIRFKKERIGKKLKQKQRLHKIRQDQIKPLNRKRRKKK